MKLDYNNFYHNVLLCKRWKYFGPLTNLAVWFPAFSIDRLVFAFSPKLLCWFFRNFVRMFPSCLVVKENNNKSSWKAKDNLAAAFLSVGEWNTEIVLISHEGRFSRVSKNHRGRRFFSFGQYICSDWAYTIILKKNNRETLTVCRVLRLANRY